MPPPTALVWFKHDLRVRDHAPLAQAAGFERAIALAVIEPEWLSSPECDPRHVAHLLAALAALREDLAALGLPLLVRTGEMTAVLGALRAQLRFTHLLSHEETGPGWSYRRDQAVARWCCHHGVDWREFAQTGVIRRLRSRDGWAARWNQRMNAPEAPRPRGFKAPAGVLADPLPSLGALGVHSPAIPLPPAGERAAWDTLTGFLQTRSQAYRTTLSSPLTAAEGCSRLSVHLAFGTISMRCVHQATAARLADAPDRSWANHLRGFAARLRWHCHFIQKLEDEPAIEHRHFARTADGLRPGDGCHPDPLDTERLHAWCEGRTGYPMVDACMRQLRATGWLNFRMRAMLVSFAAYHLWMHWREPGLFLARQFLDFEPGIHWSQMQMQSGTTGINTFRIYSPAKQARDHDPDGEYRRRWLPEFGTTAYPAPIVEEAGALAFASERLWALRRSRAAHEEATAIQARHGSRKSGLPPSGRRSTATKPRTSHRDRPSDEPDAQGRLF